MEFNFRKNGNAIIIYLKGRLDVHQCAEIEQEISKLMSFELTSHLLFNMKDVDYISSSGLRIIVSTMKILKEDNRSMAICNINNAVKKIFEVVQITDMFNIFDSEEKAVTFLKNI
ncbi:MAG TPA: STAS domain-containing protein [Spirochaetota bacterium]|nr:STAS domain-containing protein [Spirochaetota bacterium]HPF04459.1 STAS domain-containing protein [Spirochaetota bacterium]HPJ40769.1 STAS domain-containing protein [Spirochaetota bacterium]HPR36038.1 STAS domain-containing protein [Spirochaetota bacterium]HRX45952.1 STAS domain-containing protein [Spirochaetota bacterium]